jgi:chromosome segregation ATPase
MDSAILIWGGLGVCTLLLVYVVASFFRISESRVETRVMDIPVKPEADDEQLEELKEDIHDRDAEINSLKAQLERVSAEASKDKEEKISLRDAAVSLRNELDVAKISSAQKVSEAEIPLRNEIKSLKEEMLSILNQKREIEQRARSAEDEISTHKAELDGAYGTLESTKRILDEERESFANLSASFKNKDAVIEDLAKKIVASTRELSKSHDEKSKLRESLESARREHIASRSSIPQKVNQAKAILQRVVNTLKGEREEILEQKAEVDRQLAAASKEIIRLTRELEDACRAVDAARRDHQSKVSGESLSKMQAERDSLNERIESLKEELAATYESIPVKVKQSRAALQEELDALRIDHADLLEQKTEQDRQLAFYREENKLLENQLKTPSGSAGRRKGLVSEV